MPPWSCEMRRLVRMPQNSADVGSSETPFELRRTTPPGRARTSRSLVAPVLEFEVMGSGSVSGDPDRYCRCFLTIGVRSLRASLRSAGIRRHDRDQLEAAIKASLRKSSGIPDGDQLGRLLSFYARLSTSVARARQTWVRHGLDQQCANGPLLRRVLDRHQGQLGVVVGKHIVRRYLWARQA
jgi:hypothetical protein